MWKVPIPAEPTHMEITIGRHQARLGSSTGIKVLTTLVLVVVLGALAISQAAAAFSSAPASSSSPRTPCGEDRADVHLGSAKRLNEVGGASPPGASGRRSSAAAAPGSAPGDRDAGRPGAPPNRPPAGSSP